MITGHIGIALGARAVDPEAPLGWLLLASLAPDILDVAIAATGVCNTDGVYTHSLAAVAVTALVLAAAAAWSTRRGRTALLVAALVVLHLLCDYVTGLKALWANGPVVGLNLYRWPWADFAIEVPILVAGWWAARRWGGVSHRVSSRFTIIGLIGLQLAGDILPAREGNGPASVCAKADLVQRVRRIF